MPCRLVLSMILLLGVTPLATAGAVTLLVDDADGSAARSRAPVSMRVDLKEMLGDQCRSDRLRLDLIGTEAGQAFTPLPVQFVPDADGSSRGTLWWLMPPGKKGERRFRLSDTGEPATIMLAKVDKQQQRVDVTEHDRPVLRYNHGMVPVKKGTHPHFAKGETYERSDYISPLFGLSGETLTEDYPSDHPHHRGVWWSWPVTRWGDEVRDIWAVRGVRAHPVALHRTDGGAVLALVGAESVWKWADKDPIVKSEVLIRTFRQTGDCRTVDVEVRLTALVDGVAIGGRPKRGYGGFTLRAAPCKDRKITLHTDTGQAKPACTWIDYSGLFPGGKQPSGVAIFERVTNPDYPNPLHEYPGCNTVMPAYPCTREVPLAKGKTLLLEYRLLIHTGGADEKKLTDAWAAYAHPAKIAVAK